MAKEGFQLVASQKDSKDGMAVCEQNVKLILEQDGKDMGSMELKDDKGLKRTAEADDCSSVQVHVLAVDDNFVDRKIIERLVKNASFTVITVDSGIKALEVLSTNNNINLIITDYCMPEMSGYDLLKNVKATPTLKDIPVVIMSSENVPNRIERCLEEGAEEFLLKPVRLVDVKRLRSYVFPMRETTVEQRSVLCKKRKFGSDGFQVQSPDRGPRLGSVTVA